MIVDRVRALIAAGLATALAAWIVFFLLPDLWVAIEWYAAEIDWAFWFVAALLAIYFAAFYAIAKTGLDAIKAPLVEGNYGKLSRAVFQLFAFPAVQALIFIPGTILELLDGWANRVLSKPAQIIFFRSIAVFTLIWTSIYTILIFSNFWQPEPDQCKWVFPKILSCLLTKNDGLSGGLIGAGGTIFAGWLAWAAIQQQIERDGRGKT